MNDSQQTPVFASVLYLRLAQFAGKPVAEQARLRAQLETVVELGIGALPGRDRLVLDAADGLVIVVFADPGAALETADRCLQSATELPLCIGANQGPIAATTDGDTASGLVGDGIRSAVIAAGFAQPGQMLATRSFRDALSVHSPAHKARLQAAGTFSDASVRTHELYVANRGARASRRRRLLVLGIACVFGIIGTAEVLRGRLNGRGLFAPRAALMFDISPGGEVFVDGEPRGVIPPLQRLELRAGPHTIEVRHGTFPPFKLDVQPKPGEQIAVKHRFAPPAVLVFDIQPGGEVFVDGAPRGAIADIKRLELPAGAHSLEVRFGTFPPFKVDMHLAPGEQFRVKHVFALPAVLAFEVTPAGEVFVDGQFKGTIPVLQELQLDAGAHTVEVRYGKFRPLKLTLNLKPEQRFVVKHRFQKTPTWTDKMKDILGIDR